MVLVDLRRIWYPIRHFLCILGSVTTLTLICINELDTLGFGNPFFNGYIRPNPLDKAIQVCTVGKIPFRAL